MSIEPTKWENIFIFFGVIAAYAFFIFTVITWITHFG